jgi:NAD(P)-dependent dehydrogenase (short-subunit alcohol dehydrogenase family)
MNAQLGGKVALVTGASRGIGKAIAVALAQHGADVAVNYHTRGNMAEEVPVSSRSEGSARSRKPPRSQ